MVIENEFARNSQQSGTKRNVKAQSASRNVQILHVKSRGSATREGRRGATHREGSQRATLREGRQGATSRHVQILQRRIRNSLTNSMLVVSVIQDKRWRKKDGTFPVKIRYLIMLTLYVLDYEYGKRSDLPAYRRKKDWSA